MSFLISLFYKIPQTYKAAKQFLTLIIRRILINDWVTTIIEQQIIILEWFSEESRITKWWWKFSLIHRNKWYYGH